jgi:hypothetical protein
MSRFSSLRRSGIHTLSVSLFVAGSWLSGCGDDAKPPPPGGKGGTSGSGGSAGATGGKGGGTTGGSSGTSGTGGATGGSAGSSMTGGSSGTGGSAMDDGGEGGMGQGGEAGEGTAATGNQGGETAMGGEGGGGPQNMCVGSNLTFDHDSTTAAQEHTHLPIQGMARTALVDLINTGSPLTFEMPEDGNNEHTHTITFTANQLETLRNGGTVQDIESSTENGHTHTYSIECAP